MKWLIRAVKALVPVVVPALAQLILDRVAATPESRQGELPLPANDNQPGELPKLRR